MVTLLTSMASAGVWQENFDNGLPDGWNNVSGEWQTCHPLGTAENRCSDSVADPLVSNAPGSYVRSETVEVLLSLTSI